MKISTAIEERVPGGLRVVSGGIRQKKSDSGLHDNNINRTSRIVQKRASGLDLKYTECTVTALDIRSAACIDSAEENEYCPAAAADQEYAGPRYISSRQVAGQYEIEKVSLQIPGIVTDKYREAEGYKRPSVSAFQIYA